MLSTPHSADRKATLLFGYYMISVFPGIGASAALLLNHDRINSRPVPLIYSWSSSNTAGDTKGKCNSSALFIGQSLGNIIGPLLYKPSEAPEYFRGLYWNLILYCSIIVLVGITSIYLAHLNRDHSRRRVLAGKDAIIQDYSLHSLEEADRLRRIKTMEEQQVDNVPDETGRRVGSRAFDDLTDLMNDEFIFVF